jgi:hypothetical protein
VALREEDDVEGRLESQGVQVEAALTGGRKATAFWSKSSEVAVYQ